MGEALDEINPPQADDRRAAVRQIGANPDGYVGVDTRAWAVLVLPPFENNAFAVRLSNLEFDPRVELRLVTEAQGSTDTVAATVRATVTTPAARSAFCTIAAAMLDQLAADPQFDAASEVAGLTEIFTNLNARLSSTDVVGLWGELFLIAYGRDPEALAEAWHTEPRAVFDFSRGNERLEVKTTRDPARAHWFSLAQLRASAHAEVRVVSLLVTESEDGASVSDLMEQVLRRLSGRLDLAERVLRIAAKTLGVDLSEALDRFDLRASRKSVRVLAFDDVPAIAADARFLDARWRCSLADTSEIESASGLAALAAAV